MKPRQPGYVLAMTLFCLSFMLWLGYVYLAHYQQKMQMMQQFESHEKAALIFQLTKPQTQLEETQFIQTNLGSAHYWRSEEAVIGDIKLKNSHYQERFQYRLTK